MLNCKQVAELLSRRLDGPLNFSERVSLQFHLFICKLCKRYGKQLLFLENILKHCREQAEEFEDSRIESLSSEKREEMKQAIDRELGSLS